MPEDELAESLEQLDAAFDDVSEEAPALDGEYTTQLQRFEKRIAKTGTVMIHVEFVVVDGDMLGEVAYMNLFPNIIPRGARQTKKFIRSLGYEPPGKDDLWGVVAEIEAARPQCLTKITTSESEQGFVNHNIRIINLLDDNERVEVPESVKKETKTKKTKKESGPQIEVGMTVTFTDEDGEQTAVVTVLNGDGTVEAEDDTTVFTVASSKCTPVEAEEESATEDASEAEEDEEGQISLDDLVTLADSHDVELADNEDADAVAASLNEHAWVKDELREDEVDLLDGIGYEWPKVKPKPAAKAKPKTVARKKTGKKKGKR